MNYVNKFSSFWEKQSKKQKGVLLGSILFIAILIFGVSLFAFNTKYVPLYNNIKLTVNEVGQIKAELDARGVPYELEAGGSTIKVPEKDVDGLIVDLAEQGIPKESSTDYSFFSQNASWGITDNEFNIMKLDAMQNELAKLIKGMEGIVDANVMITIPKETVFITENQQETTAAIILDTQPGYQFETKQVEALYHLVSMAIPNLPKDNIVILNQYGYFDKSSQTESGEQVEYTYQQTVKKDIESDIQKRLQQMLGTMVGMDSVIVSVTADVDFTKENRVEELIEPIDLENMEGLPVSIESIHETYSGNQAAGGPAGTGEDDVAGYPGITQGEDGEYELVKEAINNEFNRIRKDIVESPYKVRDLGVQVAVNNVVKSDGDEIQFLSQQEQNSVEEGISSILNSVINTSIDKGYGEINPDEKISIVFQEFTGRGITTESTLPRIPLWMYIAGGLLVLIIIALIFMLLRKPKSESEEIATEEVTEVYREVTDITDNPDTEADVRKKQLEKMAGDKPEDFAKLLRSWIADD